MTFSRLNPITGEVASTAPAMQAAIFRRLQPLLRRPSPLGGRLAPMAVAPYCKRRLMRWQPRRMNSLLP